MSTAGEVVGAGTSDRAEKFVLVAALVLAGVGLFLIVLSREAVPYATLWPSLLLVGVGSGLVLPATVAVISSTPVERAGVALSGASVAGDGGAAFIEDLRIVGWLCVSGRVRRGGGSLARLRPCSQERRGAQDEAGDLALELYPTGREETWA